MDVDPGQLKNLQCKLPEGKFITLSPTAPNYDKIYDTAMQAAVHGRNILLRVNTDGGQCSVQYVLLFGKVAG